MENKRKISVEIVADSIDNKGNRITSSIFQFPRYILAELNTHRVLSKNSASSRAIPFKKMVKSVNEDPFIPIAWQKDHSGMQGVEYFVEEILGSASIDDGVLATDYFKQLWLKARNEAVKVATTMNNTGLTKQLCNRLLEPFLWHRVLITGTEWDNFFALRAHEDAEIHIAKLANEALIAFNNSTPKPLKPGEWHIPFGDKIDESELYKLTSYWAPNDGGIISSEYEDALKEVNELKIKIAITRCARVSYDNFDGTQDYEKDLQLFDRLFARNPIHASPSEHVARCMTEEEYYSNIKGESKYVQGRHSFEESDYGWCRNFKGFIQYRTLLPNDTIFDDERLLKWT